MSFYVAKGSSLLDEISDPEFLVSRVPSFAQFFDSVDVLRDAVYEARQVTMGRQRVGMTNDGTMMRVACVPQALWAAILAVEPKMLQDKKLFYKWLNRNPQYRVGYSKPL